LAIVIGGDHAAGAVEQDQRGIHALRHGRDGQRHGRIHRQLDIAGFVAGDLGEGADDLGRLGVQHQRAAIQRRRLPAGPHGSRLRLGRGGGHGRNRRQNRKMKMSHDAPETSVNNRPIAATEPALGQGRRGKCGKMRLNKKGTRPSFAGLATLC